MTAEHLMLAGGLAAFSLTLYWVRSRELSEKYAVGWVCVALLILLCGIFPNVIIWAAEKAHLANANAILFIALTVIYLFSFSVSVSLTYQQRRNVRLMQELALMDARLRELERKRPGAETAV